MQPGRVWNRVIQPMSFVAEFPVFENRRAEGMISIILREAALLIITEESPMQAALSDRLLVVSVVFRVCCCRLL